MCACAFTGVEPVLVRAPKNVAVIQGSDVTLDCTSDNRTSVLTWFNQSCTSYADRDCIRSSRIYNGFNDLNNPPRFSVTSINNARHVTRDLNISQTQPTDAGEYVCIENIPGQGVQQIRSAQVVILGTKNY